MNIKRYLNKKYNLHVIENDNFRSCSFEISFRSKFDPKKSIAFSLLADILTDQSVKYPTSKYITRHLEESFILNFYGSFTRVGRTMQTHIFCDYVDPKYIDDKKYLENTFKFIFEVISNPVIIDNGFEEKNFNIVKNKLIKELNEYTGNNKFISLKNALKLFTNHENISFHAIDLMDFLQNLTKEDLYNYYIDLISNSSVDIFVSGSSDKTIIKKLVDKYYPFNNTTYEKYDDLTYAKNRIVPKIKFDKSHYKQSSVVMICNTNCLTMFEREFVMPFYLNILNNNGLSSKLYQNLREKNSLCYGVNSTYKDRCNYLIIRSNVIVGKERKAIKLIKKSLNEMKKNISDKEFIGAYYNYQSSLKGLLDSLSAITRLYLNCYFAGYSTYEEKKKLFKKVTVNDIYNLSKKIRLNTIYVLKGDMNERDND